MLTTPLVSYVAPFFVFMLLLGISPSLGLPPTVDLSLRLLLPALIAALFSRHLLSFRFSSGWLSVLLGVGVFAIWVAPDLLLPGYRDHWLFQNGLTGKLSPSTPPLAYAEPLNVFLRVARASLLVPIVEELFWRGFLMRWLVDSHFDRVPLGRYTHFSFFATAVLFAVEHGPYWEVGLLAGLAYNWWMVRTRNLNDLILAHAVTNFCLAVFVLWTKRWELWM